LLIREKLLEPFEIRSLKTFFDACRTRSRSLSKGRPLSDQQILLALSALCSLGVLSEERTHFVLDKTRFGASAETRALVREVLEGIVEPSESCSEAELCVSLPPTIRTAAALVIREMSADLRAGLLDVIASAEQSIIIASPFWDAKTASEMKSFLEKRVLRGLRCVILGRFSTPDERRALPDLLKLTRDGDCKVLSWFEDVNASDETFHFKAASADGGKIAYLGSANMTHSSLRSRMELGVLLRGRPAADLDGLLEVVLKMAKSIAP
jgi:phosphatidylserine/phosphatidylglycerophosphate/cardiolipin synthase-like enzyme